MKILFRGCREEVPLWLLLLLLCWLLQLLSLRLGVCHVLDLSCLLAGEGRLIIIQALVLTAVESPPFLPAYLLFVFLNVRPPAIWSKLGLILVALIRLLRALVLPHLQVPKTTEPPTQHR